MGIEIVSILVIIGIAIGGYIIFVLYTRAQKRKHELLNSPKKLHDWMATEKFYPEHFSFFHGTGIAMKDDDERMVIYRDEGARFYALSELSSAKAHRAIEAVRPLGAAPGVIEKRDILRFHLDLTFKTISVPITILLETPDEMQAWEMRIKMRLSQA